LLQKSAKHLNKRDWIGKRKMQTLKQAGKKLKEVISKTKQPE